MNTKGHYYPKYILLQAVYFKLRFMLSYRDVEELMKIRGVIVDHATIQRWVYKFASLLEAEMKNRKGRVGASRQRMSAQSLLIKAIANNYRPRVINIDKSGSNTAAIKVYNKRSFSKIKIRQCKYLNNIVEQDHRFIKWRIQNGLGFKSFESARRTLNGIEVVHMLRKNQMIRPGISMFKSFCKLAG